MPDRGEQPARPDSATQTTQHEHLPDATGGAGLREYFLRQARDGRGEDPAPKGRGQPEAEGVDDAVSQRERGPRSPEQPGALSDEPDSEVQEAEEQELDPAAEDETEQPDDDTDEGLELDGQRYTRDDIRRLIEERDQGGMRLEDYRRKTQRLARVRQEAEALGEQYQGLGEVFQAKEQLLGQVIQANLRQFEQTDTSQMSPQQFEDFKRQWAAAKQGADFLAKQFQEVEGALAQRRDAAMQKRARTTVELLRWHEPRWDDQNQFYGKLREFTVREGLMSPEQFDHETDFLKLRGLIALMDAHEAPGVIDEAASRPRPPRRSRNRARNNQGQFQGNRQAALDAVRQSSNAKADGSLRSWLQSNLAAEDGKRRR
jgi:hypothetical protein